MDHFRRAIRFDQSYWVNNKLQKLNQFVIQKSILKRLARQACSESGHDHHYELTLPDDMLFKIFVLLPAESLCKMQFVCKKWFEMINSSLFIEFHRQQSKMVLISRTQLFNAYRIPYTGDSNHKPYFNFVDFDIGQDSFVESSLISKVSVKASYDGLVLGETDKNQSLILMNPMTRKHMKLPLGTIGFRDCYGLVFCSKDRTYKVVHLFRESSANSVCEIYGVNTRKWTVIDGPSKKLRDLTVTPVSVGGSMYWMPRRHGGKKIICMNVEEEKFLTKKLPIVCTSNDRLVEIGGVLGFVTHAALNLIQVWILTKAGEGAEHWVKQYSIYMQCDARSVVPVCSSGNGRGMVFEFPGNDLYVYDFGNDNMKKIYSSVGDANYHQKENVIEQLYIPHRNTLVSWNHHDH